MSTCVMNKEIIYHGSSIAVTEPKIIKGQYTKDFGEGFYCTIFEHQAIRWANKYDTSILSLYEYIPNENLRILHFPEMTDEWLDFIVDCRNGRPHDYDIVIGAMADDQIYNYVADFLNGVISREAFWALAKFKKPTHQICFCTEEALKCIKFHSSKECHYGNRG